jgi:hypothetical protein
MNNSHLKATVYDLPTTRPFAEKTIKRFKLEDRIQFVDGNYLTDPIEGRFDAIWLSHILHGEGPEDCRMIIQKAVGHWRRAASIIIHDFILNNSMDGPLFPGPVFLKYASGHGLRSILLRRSDHRYVGRRRRERICGGSPCKAPMIPG